MKTPLKKFLLSSIMALQLSNGLISNDLSIAYAKENDKEILFDENGKILHMIGILINNHKKITIGYIFIKDNTVYVKDAKDERIYNFTNISKHIQYPEIIYTDIRNVLPKELKNKNSITEEEANKLVSRFNITEQTTKIWGTDNLYDYTYKTFSTTDCNNKNLHIANCSIFDHTDDAFYSSLVSNDYNEENEEINLSVNDYKLGLKEVSESYPIYSNIYQKKAIGKEDKMGIITRYYVFNKNGDRIATLKTQKEVDEFIANNKNFLNEYTWKASFYNGNNIDKILNAIENNQPISYDTTTYFIDYKPAYKRKK